MFKLHLASSQSINLSELGHEHYDDLPPFCMEKGATLEREYGVQYREVLTSRSLDLEKY